MAGDYTENVVWFFFEGFVCSSILLGGAALAAVVSICVLTWMVRKAIDKAKHQLAERALCQVTDVPSSDGED